MSTKKEAEVIEVQNSFVTTIGNIRKGKAVSELSDALKELVKAVTDTGKSGTLIYKLKIKPMGKSDDENAVVVIDTVETKLPQPDQQAAIFFVDENHQLVRDNPNQASLPLRMVEGGKQSEPETKAKAAEAK